MNLSALNDLIQEQEQSLLFSLKMESRASDQILLCWSAMSEARQQLACFERIRATHAKRLQSLYQQREALQQHHSHLKLQPSPTHRFTHSSVRKSKPCGSAFKAEVSV